MKIEKLKLEEHPFFGTIEIDFTGPDGKALDTIVVAGINGSGKTTLLETIWKIFTVGPGKLKSSHILTVDFPEFGVSKINLGQYADDSDSLRSLVQSQGKDAANIPNIFYMPTEINFEELKTNTLSYSPQYKFGTIVNRNTLENIPSFIATEINSEVYKNPDLPAKNAIDKVCNEFNALFDAIEIDARVVGLNPAGEKFPVFQNSAGKRFDINHLSSGEKQLFVRAMALKMLRAENAIILIDEPEISMHPKWQQRVVKVYEGIGKDNQVIIATHSPHVVSSVKKESVKLLKRQKDGIEVVDYKTINGSYGLPVNLVLQELMELKTTRDPEVDREIRALWEMVYNNTFDTDAFRSGYAEQEKLLGSEDEDLLTMRIEIAKQKAKQNAGQGKKTPGPENV